ncbi:MAG: TolC family protein [Campylobacterota bacterium]|nr:TolC family protein [Campylobacterota bacterium]
MKRVNLSKIVSALLLSSACMLSATSLQDAVNGTLAQNPELKAISENNKAFKQYIDEAKGGYLPTIDLEVTGESKSTENKPDNKAIPKTTIDQNGYDAQLRLEQLLYDGGLTPAKIDEAKFRDQVNTLNNKAKVEDVMLSGVKSYLDLVKYDQRLKLSKINLDTHEEYLSTAKANEEVSGNALDMYEVQAKLHLAKKNYIEEVDNNQIAVNSFKRITGSDVQGDVCMPQADRATLPGDLDSLVQTALEQNHGVLAQMAKINEQRAIINQEQSKFLPTLKFNLSGTWDDDLIAENNKRNIYSASIVLTYNLFNGGKDTISRARETTFLKESQSILDSQTDLIVDEISSAYTTYNNTVEKIKELRGYVATNEEILSIYKDQFEGGTRTFVDVLDIESDLHSARTQLIDEEVVLVDTYYTMLSLTSSIQDSVLAQSAQNCVAAVPMVKKAAPKQDELEDLQDVVEEAPAPAPVVEAPAPVVEAAPVVEEAPMVQEAMPTKVETRAVDYASQYGDLIQALEGEFASDIADGSVVFNKDTMGMRLAAPSSSMPLNDKGQLVMSDEYKAALDAFIPRYVNVLKSYKDSIAKVNVDGFSSSNYVAAQDETANFMANLKVSKARASKVLSYVKKIDDNMVTSNRSIMNMFKPYGRAYANPVLNTDGSENIEMSKRVEFIVKGK